MSLVNHKITNKAQYELDEYIIILAFNYYFLKLENDKNVKKIISNVNPDIFICDKKYLDILDIDLSKLDLFKFPYEDYETSNEFMLDDFIEDWSNGSISEEELEKYEY